MNTIHSGNMFLVDKLAWLSSCRIQRFRSSM